MGAPAVISIQDVQHGRQDTSPGGYCHTKAVGVCRQSPMEHMEREREIKKFMVTKRELLNNLSDIYKCKVSQGGTFSVRNFLFDERENYQV